MAEGKTRLWRVCICGFAATVACVLIILYIYNNRPTFFHSIISKPVKATLIPPPSSSPTVSVSSELKRRFPVAVIIGVRKGGTKAIISMLDAHPQITAAKGEVHFFDRSANFHQGMEWYLSRMPLTRNGELGIEKSPSYFVVPGVPERIVKLSKDVKLILIVRDPVTRTISDYTQLDLKKARKARSRPSFETSILKPDGTIRKSRGIINVSMYDVHFERWLKYFSLSSILVVNGDQLVLNPFDVVSQVEKFLGVEKYFTKEMFYFNATKGFYCWKKNSDSTRCLGSSKGHKHPPVSDKTILKLKEFFRPHMKTFCLMAKVTFSWCNL